MVVREVKKLWYGDSPYREAKITLRSYWVSEAIKKLSPIIVKYKNDKMTLTVEQLRNPVKISSFKSKIGSKNYDLFDYLWIPDK